MVICLSKIFELINNIENEIKYMRIHIKILFNNYQ